MSDTLHIKDKDIVVPGQELAVGMSYLPSSGMYREGDKIIASNMGMIRIDGKVLKLIPLSGKYLPKKNDVIIATVKDINMSGWQMYTNSAYVAFLQLRDGSEDYIRKGSDLTKYYNIGDHVVCKIINVTSQMLIDLTMRGPGLKKLVGGRIVKVAPSKVPRIIGKQGSMVSMVKQSTNCNIVVGQNGLVWIKGAEPQGEIKAVEAIKRIEAESHKTGLTEEIKKFLGGDQ